MPQRITILCHNCQCSLGETDGPILYIGPVKIERLITMHCLCCGARRRWEPAQPLATLAQPCYTDLVSA